MTAKSSDMKEVSKLFNKVGRIQFMIGGLIISGFILFGQEFIRIWAGNGYDEAYRVGLFLMIPVTIPIVQNLGIEILRAKNMHKVRSVVYLFIAIANIFISIPCIKVWGATGAAVGTMISLVIGNGLFINIYYHKKVGLDIFSFWKEIGKLLPALLLSSLCALVIKTLIPFGGILGLCVEIILYCMVYAGFMWFLGMNTSEKALVSKPLKK